MLRVLRELNAGKHDKTFKKNIHIPPPALNPTHLPSSPLHRPHKIVTVSVVLLILLVVAAIVLNNRFNGVARFRAWKAENEDALMTVFECLTIAVVTMQTLVMVTASHEEVGGSSPPPLFDDVMKFFSFCSFDIINDFLPGQFILFNLSTPRPPSLPRYSTPPTALLPRHSTRHDLPP